MKRYSTLLCLAALVLVACAERDAGSVQQERTEAKTLPAPARNSGSVTGMPDDPEPAPATAVTGQPPEQEPQPIVVDGTLDPANPETGLLPGGTDPVLAASGQGDERIAAPAEPTPEDAVAVIRDYYASINSGSFARAYSLWSDNGRSSGQSPQQFADGFADTASVAADVLPPGRVDAGAGSRYIEVPVAITATRRDGSIHQYVGAYTLRRAMVDGASAEQRAWRIASADLREVKP